MADRFRNYQAGIEHLVAQLYSLEAMYNTSIPSIVPSLSKIVWGNIGGDISKQKDLLNVLTQLKREIEEETIDKISAAFVYKGSVANYEDLPTEDLNSGDCYNVESNGANYVWNGEDWDKLSETFDTSTFVAKTELDGILEYYYLKSEVDTLINNISSDLGLRIDANADSIIDLRSYVTELNNSLVNSINDEIQARKDADTILQNNIDSKIDKYEQLPNDAEIGVIGQYVGTSTGDYKNGYFYKYIGNPGLEFIPTADEGECTTQVTVSIENFKAYLETLCEGRSFTAKDVIKGQIGYHNLTDRYSFSATTDDGKFFAISVLISDLVAAGFTFSPVLGPRQGIIFKCNLTNNAWKQINVQPEQDISDKADKSEVYTKTEVDNLIQDIDIATLRQDLNQEISDRQTNDSKIISKIWSNNNLDTGHLYTKKTNAQGGYALIFNEEDGGGSQVFDKTSNTLSYVGTNLEEGEGDKNGVNVQIYSKDKTSNEGVRLNVNTQKAYYLKGSNKTNTDEREIAVKADITSLSSELQAVINLKADESLLDNYYLKTETYNQSEIDNKDQAIKDDIYGRIWSNKTNPSAGHLYTKMTNAQGGYALIFNESDGGGSQVYDKTDDIISYVGTNLEEGEGAENGVNVQLYSKNKTTNEGVRVNINSQKAYYLKGANKVNVEGREIAVVEDVNLVQQGLTELENNVNDSISTQNGNIQSLVLQIQELYSKITDLKSLDYEVYTFYDGSDTDLENEEKAFMLSGVITTGTRVDGQAVTLDDATMESSYVEFDAIEDITIKNTTLSGNVAKTTTNALFKLHADGYISVRDCVITPETAYNGIEIGLSQGLAKSVIIDNCTFDGKFSNNGISIFGMDNGGVVTISNCYFKEVSNLLRLSNRTNTSWTINLINCVCDKWELGEYAGMILLQDYTSGSAVSADENNQFAKLTINIQNCTKPDGTKIVSVEDLSTICGSQNNDQIIYMWDSWRNHTEYGDKYPTINII